MANEDFSFPTLTDVFPCSIDSPPLWHVSSTASPNSSHEETAKVDNEEDCQGKSFSDVEGRAKMGRKDGFDDDDDEEEEKMDMLWEDFNEELCRNRGSDISSGDMVALGCVQELKLSKTGGALVSQRRPSMVMIMKVLKKLFLLSPHKRRHAW